MPPDRYVASKPEPGLVAGIILAAGESRRLGRPKQLLDIYGEPAIRRVARIARLSDLDKVTVVLGSFSDRMQPLLIDLAVDVLLNPDFASGQASSLRVGLESVTEDFSAVLFLLGDQPTMEPAAINAVLEIWRRERPPIVQARYRGTLGHPVLFARSRFPELAEVKGDLGAREVIRRHLAVIRYVEIDQDAPPDLDTEADYQRLIADKR